MKALKFIGKALVNFIVGYVALIAILFAGLCLFNLIVA